MVDPMVEGDPLENPVLLLGENDPEPEMLIFLEHYLPQDLAEVPPSIRRALQRLLTPTAKPDCPCCCPFMLHETLTE